MKTTLDISDHLLFEARKVAAEERRSLGEVIEDALKLFVAHRRSRPGTERIELPVCNAGEPLTGIDLNRTAK